MRCERTEVLKKRFRNCDAEIDIRRRVGCDNKEKWQKMGIYNIKCKNKGERLVGKHESEVEITSDGQ